ncbi:MAG: hypothetical protein ACREJ2_06840 [Planctomycetota bacterium]
MARLPSRDAPKTFFRTTRNDRRVGGLLHPGLLERGAAVEVCALFKSV